MPFKARICLLLASGWILLGCQHLPQPQAGAEGPSSASVHAQVRAAQARGDRALNDGAIEEARQAYNEVLRSRAADPDATLGLAQSYLAVGDVESAENYANALRSTDGSFHRADLTFLLGEIALQKGQTDAAIARLSESVEIEPDHWRAWRSLGRAQVRRREFVAARQSFASAARHAPREAALGNDIGMSYLSADKPVQAIPHFEQALEDNPQSEPARANLRIARAMAGNYDDAVSGSSPAEMADSLNNVGYVAVLNGDLDIADRLLRRAVAISPVYHKTASANLALLSQVRQQRLARMPSGQPRTASASGYRDLTPPALAADYQAQPAATSEVENPFDPDDRARALSAEIERAWAEKTRLQFEDRPVYDESVEAVMSLASQTRAGHAHSQPSQVQAEPVTLVNSTAAEDTTTANVETSGGSHESIREFKWSPESGRTAAEDTTAEKIDSSGDSDESNREFNWLPESKCAQLQGKKLMTCMASL